jgi:hypothetical protein
LCHPGASAELVDCSGGEEEFSLESGNARKLLALEDVLAKHRSARTIIFCNKIESCRSVENHLTRRDRHQQSYRCAWGSSSKQQHYSSNATVGVGRVAAAECSSVAGAELQVLTVVDGAELQVLTVVEGAELQVLTVVEGAESCRCQKW